MNLTQDNHRKNDLKVLIQFQTKNSNDHLLNTFRTYQAENKFIDLQIVGKDKSHSFNCHRLVLGTKSWLFHSILNSNDYEEYMQDEFTSIIIPEMTSHLLIKFANYMYGGAILEDLDEEAKDWLKYLGAPVPIKSSSTIKKEKVISDNQTTPIEILEPVEVPFLNSCPFKTCNHIFDNQADVEAHFSSAHKVKPKGFETQKNFEDTIVDLPEQLLPHKCVHCEKSFATQTYLQHHTSLHCQICGKKFNSSSKVAQHKHTHQTSNIFTCEFKGCEKTFKAKRYLLAHSKLHQERSSHECEICRKILAGPREMRAHLRVHTGEKPFTCQECNQSFRNRSTYNTHKKRHMNKRNHVCPECNHPFIQLGDLRKHIRSKHTLEKPFSCDECGKTFARSDYLLKHTRAHKKQSQQNSNDPDIEEETKVNTLLSEAMLEDDDDEVALEPLEATEPLELVLQQ